MAIMSQGRFKHFVRFGFLLFLVPRITALCEAEAITLTFEAMTLTIKVITLAIKAITLTSACMILIEGNSIT